MKTITAAEFKTEIELDPAWAATLTEPVKITGVCDMEGSAITHLSPLLHFIGPSEEIKLISDVATFTNCKHLQEATGKFAGFVSFDGSGITRIDKLIVTGTDITGDSATFQNCKSLLVAEGTFAGHADFSSSGVMKIGELTIKKRNDEGHKASFNDCNVHLPKKYLTRQYAMDESTRRKNLRRIDIGKAMKAAPDIEI